jgi:integrase/recombinase XerD
VDRGWAGRQHAGRLPPRPGLYARWLSAERAGLAPESSRESDLLAYIARAPRRLARHERESAPDRFKRFFRWALRERLTEADPTLRLRNAKQPLRVPKSLSESQVEALLGAPDVSRPLGLRDRAMLELLYASGLRVSELVTLKTVQLGLAEGALRVTGKGSKERLVPFGEEAHAWLTRYLAQARAPILGGRPATRSSSPPAARP